MISLCREPDTSKAILKQYVIPLSYVFVLHLSSSYLTGLLYTGDGDVAEKPVEPVKVYSEKELVREIEKIAATLVPEKDWSVRIAAMQRVEGLVLGGLLANSIFGLLLIFSMFYLVIFSLQIGQYI